MPSERTAEQASRLQRDGARVRALPVEQLDALPSAVQDLIVSALKAANVQAAEESAAVQTPPVEDWAGHLPGASAPLADPRVAAAALADEPVARTVRLDADTEEWRVAELRLTPNFSGADLPRFPTAAEYRGWSDEQIAELRLEPEQWIANVVERDLTDLDDEELRDLPGMDDPMPDPHPFTVAVECAELAQATMRHAEAGLVRSALSAWRVAVEASVGTVDAAVNSLFKGSVMVQIAHALQISERTALIMVNTAEDLEQHLPKTWARFTAGEVPWRGMQMAHAQMEGLDPAFVAAYDEKAARVLTSVPMPDVKQRLHEARERLQATTAVERHQRALKDQHVEIENLPHGMAALTNLMPAAEAILVRMALHEQAVAASEQPGETRSIRLLESLILTDYFVQGARTDAPSAVPGMLVPARTAAVCKVGLLLPAMTALDASDVPAILQGYGPIDIETATRLAGAATTWIKVLTDPVTGAVWDIGRKRYRPTADMRALLGFLDRGGRSPNGTVTRGRIEIDHVTPFRQHLARGDTAIANLVMLAGRDHDKKTAGHVALELRADRTLVFTDFAGNRIQVPREPLEPTPVPRRFLSAA